MGDVKKRVYLPFELHKADLISKEDFLYEFSTALLKASEQRSDFPKLHFYMASIFSMFARDEVLSFSDIDIKSGTLDEDEAAEYNDFVETFLQSSVKMAEEK